MPDKRFHVVQVIAHFYMEKWKSAKFSCTMSRQSPRLRQETPKFVRLDTSGAFPVSI